jgi:hypothetical protein
LKNSILFRATLFCLLTAGILFRIWSFQQNTRLYGDVNLFALTARQLALHGRLTYPMKYDYTSQALYLTLESPASQHPPLWPLFGAILARLWGTPDTYLMLKLLTFLTGFCLWILFLPKPESISFIKLLPFGLIAISPWLVDFSTNGSPYIFISLILLLAEWFWRSKLFTCKSALLGFGAFCALAILTHYNLILLPLSFVIGILTQEGISTRKKVLHLGVFLTALLFFISPWLVWNWNTFGQWFHSPSSVYILEQLGMAHIELAQGEVVWTVEALPIVSIFQRYSLLLAKSAWAGGRQFIAMLTPLGFICLLAALALRWRKKQSRLSMIGIMGGLKILTSPMILYLLTIVLWATAKTRFLIPLLPVSYLLIEEGVEHSLKTIKSHSWVLWAGIALLSLWTMLPYRQQPFNLYYGAETASHARQYDQMKELANLLAEKPGGVVLGVSSSLDGGIETIYWTKQPFVAGRGINESLWNKLATDFRVRYFWSECTQKEKLERLFPNSRLLLSNDLYCVLELP